jgi:hypothetical protein
MGIGLYPGLSDGADRCLGFSTVTRYSPALLLEICSIVRYEELIMTTHIGSDLQT